MTAEGALRAFRPADTAVKAVKTEIMTDRVKEKRIDTKIRAIGLANVDA